MRLLRLADVETGPNDRVYCYSRSRAILLAMALLGAAAWLVFHAITTGWKLGYYIAAVMVLFLELMRRFFTARFRPTNWLVRMNDEGMFIQFRSYWRLIRERVTTPDPQGRGTVTQFLRYVELELAGDVAPLATALEAEITERAPMEKRWYGKGSTLYQDHPVRMQTPPFLQMHWQVAPGAKKFLAALRPYTTIAETVSLSQDFTNLQSLSRDEQQKRLRELARRGENIAAVYTARKLYGCGLVEAKEMVDGLRTQSGAGA